MAQALPGLGDILNIDIANEVAGKLAMPSPSAGDKILELSEVLAPLESLELISEITGSGIPFHPGIGAIPLAPDLIGIPPMLPVNPLLIMTLIP
ncbi:hypothetical protein GCM10027567_18040 [Spongiibacter taiwanensis]